jgi:hypothetical protein
MVDAKCDSDRIFGCGFDWVSVSAKILAGKSRGERNPNLLAQALSRHIFCVVSFPAISFSHRIFSRQIFGLSGVVRLPAIHRRSRRQTHAQ